MSAIPAPGEQAAGYIGAARRTVQGGRLGLALVVIASAQLIETFAWTSYVRSHQ